MDSQGHLNNNTKPKNRILTEKKSEPTKSEHQLAIMFKARNIILTGKPGVGKTTLIQRIIEHLQRCGRINCCGFYTKETRDTANQRTGFEIITLDGNQLTLAKTTNFDSVRRPKVGKYLVYVENVDTVASIIRNTSKNELLVVDEIGKMELLSKSFETVVNEAIDCTPLLATIPLNYLTPLLDRIHRSPNTKLFCITKSNRDTIFKEIVDCIEEHFKAK